MEAMDLLAVAFFLLVLGIPLLAAMFDGLPPYEAPESLVQAIRKYSGVAVGSAIGGVAMNVMFYRFSLGEWNWSGFVGIVVACVIGVVFDGYMMSRQKQRDS